MANYMRTPVDPNENEEQSWQERLRTLGLDMVGNPETVQKPDFERQPDYSLMNAEEKTETPAAPTPAAQPQNNDAVEQAQQMLTQNMTGDTAGVQPWQQQLNDTLNQILNREKFSFDLNGEALYDQYKDQYMLMGQQAMMDTMGQAAAMTGGYGNSYAQTVGQQAYNSHLQQLNNRIPELYSLALSKYQSDGNDLLDRYAILKAERDYEDAQDGGSGGSGGSGGGSGGGGGGSTDPFAGKDLRSLLVAAGNKQAALALAEQMAQWGYADEAYALYQELYDKAVSGGGGGSSGIDRRPSRNPEMIAMP